MYHALKPGWLRSTMAPHLAAVLACLLTASMILLASCSGLLNRPEAGIVVRDKVTVCFSQSGEGQVLASLQPDDCYSMRTTRVWLESGSALVDENGHTIHFHSEFKLEQRTSIFPKLPDCLGGGKIEIDLGELEVGLYQVYSGDQHIGQLSVTSGLPWRDQCLSTSQEQ
jgi:hypothetical protein